MIFIYPILTVMKLIPKAIEILPAAGVVLIPPVLIPLFALLSPILTPLVTLLPYTLKVFGSIDQLAVQLLQLLNGIPALTNSFFILRRSQRSFLYRLLLPSAVSMWFMILCIESCLYHSTYRVSCLRIRCSTC